MKRTHASLTSRLALIAVTATGLTGCATSQPDAELTRLRYQVQESNKEIDRLNLALEQQTIPDAVAVPAALPKMEVSPVVPPGESDALLPPDAQPGECYARVMTPATYETVTERVLLQEASEEISIAPAEYEWVEEQVLVKEASEQLEVVPAEYEMVEEQVLVAPASTRVEQVPAEYEWVEEQVLVKPAHTVWKKGKGPIQKVDNATGEIMCLVEVPAQYETVKKKVVKSPATSRTVEVPAEYKTVEKMVMTKPPSTRTVSIPAEYQTMKVQKQVRAEEKVVKPIEAQYQTVEKQVLQTPARVEWRRVLCETNLSMDIVKAIQSKLAELGFNPGPIDGVIGRQTSAAVQAYQANSGLAVGGLTFETMKNLGITVQ